MDRLKVRMLDLAGTERGIVAADGVVVELALGAAVAVVEVGIVDLELLLGGKPSELDAERQAENQPESQNAKYDAKLRLSCNTLNVKINKSSLKKNSRSPAAFLIASA